MYNVGFQLVAMSDKSWTSLSADAEIYDIEVHARTVTNNFNTLVVPIHSIRVIDSSRYTTFRETKMEDIATFRKFVIGFSQSVGKFGPDYM